ncbi:hypothetical protein IMCC12053_2098 [Celeribacter marinus]|uniref:Uncharacterized protein n=1 Tax=Celeribacter marinus TaxID=1397108 RepID=A0A0N7HIS6_9RHOB|nr:hypothetical protein IMCC12053_2098 [Celeribacter marinus]
MIALTYPARTDIISFDSCETLIWGNVHAPPTRKTGHLM